MQRDGEYTPGPFSFRAAEFWLIACLLIVVGVGYSLFADINGSPDTADCIAEVEER